MKKTFKWYNGKVLEIASPEEFMPPKKREIVYGKPWGQDDSDQFWELLEGSWEETPFKAKTRKARNAFISVFSIQFSVISDSISYLVISNYKAISNPKGIDLKWGSSDLQTAEGVGLSMHGSFFG